MMKNLAIILVCGPLMACSSPAQPITSYPLRDRGTVADLVPPAGLGVVVVLDPENVGSCYQPLWLWSEWERSNPGRFILLFSREPNAGERRQIVLRRVRADGILAAGRAKRGDAPAEYIFRNGVLLRESRGRLGVATARITEGGGTLSAREFLAYLQRTADGGVPAEVTYRRRSPAERRT